jgi:hypothetical protein
MGTDFLFCLMLCPGAPWSRGVSTSSCVVSQFQIVGREIRSAVVCSCAWGKSTNQEVSMIL